MSTAQTLSNLDNVDYALAFAETDALTAWGTYRAQAEPLGLEFGEKMYKLRNMISARGTEGEGFRAWLQSKDIPKSTAYYWIHSYEISIGEREPDAPKKPVQSVQVPKSSPPVPLVNAESVPATDVVAEAAAARCSDVETPEYKPEKPEYTPASVELPSPGPISPGPIEPVCAFDPLISALYCLTNNGNDGVEHKFITMMEEALARCESNSVSGDGRETVIYLLDRVSKEFAIYAQRFKGLKNAGFVQAGLSVTNRGMACQTDHSAPKFEVANAS